MKKNNGSMVDYTGQKFNYLTVIKYHGKTKINESLWECECVCGAKRIIRSFSFRSGRTKSCGCVHKLRTTHNKSKTKIYKTWSAIIQRCKNPNDRNYYNYGGRGIAVCDSWLNFENFYKDMGEIPKGKSIDRINNDGNYCKENCKWSTVKEQCNNKRNTYFITYNGKTQTLTQWSEEIMIDSHVLYTRLKRLKWSVEKTLTTKKEERKPRKRQESESA